MYSLHLPEIALWINIGSTQDERRTKQLINVDLTVKFKDEPLACETDEINDVLNFKNIVDLMSKKLSEMEFRTMEKLTKEIVTLIEPKISKVACALCLKVTKVKVPVANMACGASFIYSKEW